MKLVLYKTYNNDTSYLDIPNLVQKKIIPWIISFYENFFSKTVSRNNQLNRTGMVMIRAALGAWETLRRFEDLNYVG